MKKFSFLFALLLAACGSPTTLPDLGAPPDFASAVDMSHVVAPDFATTADMSGGDLAAAYDLATAYDLASADSNPEGLPVLFIGDSITMGATWNSSEVEIFETGGFRTRFYLDMLSRGVNLRMLGTLENGPVTIDRHHEGHSGYELGSPATNIKGTLFPNIAIWFATYPVLPKYVFLMAGTNDIHHRNGAPQTISRLGPLTDEIHAYAPDAIIFVLTICPMVVPTWPNLATDVDLYNQSFTATLSTRPFTRRVDTHAVCSPLGPDNLHPAMVAYDAMEQVFEKPFLKEIGL